MTSMREVSKALRTAAQAMYNLREEDRYYIERKFNCNAWVWKTLADEIDKLAEVREK